MAFSFLSFEALAGYSRILAAGYKMSKEEIISQCDSMISNIRQFLFSLRKKTNVTFFLHNASGLPLQRWRRILPVLSPIGGNLQFARNRLNNEISTLSQNIDNCILIDEREIANKIGIRECAKSIVNQSKYLGMFHTSYFGKYLAKCYSEHSLSYRLMKNCKAILVDFDNTLWRGVMADGEVQHFHEKQHLLKSLKDQGILLIAISKNNMENIRWEEMTLKKNDFVLLKINWNFKANSVDEISKILNLGINSFVFLDDNRHERALVLDAHPEIVALDPEENQTWRFIKNLCFYPNTQSTEEAKIRTRLYQEQATRSAIINSGSDIKSNLQSLALWFTFNEAKHYDIDRLVELINRTNQFNLTTRRYTKTQLMEFLKGSEHKIFISSLGDKFGSLGVVAVIILEILNKSECVIDSFVMSCRAMGFSLEKALIDYVVLYCIKHGYKNLFAEYIPTDRNSPCASLYDECKFIRLDNKDKYRIETDSYVSICPDWLLKR